MPATDCQTESRKKKKNKAQRWHRKQKREAAEIRNSSDNYYLRATKTLQTYTDIKRDRVRQRESKRDPPKAKNNKNFTLA